MTYVTYAKKAWTGYKLAKEVHAEYRRYYPPSSGTTGSTRRRRSRRSRLVTATMGGDPDDTMPAPVYNMLARRKKKSTTRGFTRGSADYSKNQAKRKRNNYSDSMPPKRCLRKKARRGARSKYTRDTKQDIKIASLESRLRKLSSATNDYIAHHTYRGVEGYYLNTNGDDVEYYGEVVLNNLARVKNATD